MRLDDVLLLAGETHWSEREILSLPRARFRYYVNRLSLKKEHFETYLTKLQELSGASRDR